MRRTLVPAVLAALLATGCGTPDQPPVAEVNGVKITAAELGRAIPRPVEPGKEEEARRRTLDDMVNRELVVQEAQQIGLDTAVAEQYELQARAAVINEFLQSLAERRGKASDADVAAAYRLLQNEVRVRVLSVPSESLARLIERELARGVPFETLAARYSQDASGRRAGEQPAVTELRFPKAIRDAVVALAPGQHTQAIRYGGAWEFVYLIDRKPAEPPPPPLAEIRQRFVEQMESDLQRFAAANYTDSLRSAVRYDDAALRILLDPVDAITLSEQESTVAVLGVARRVKVGQLLNAVRRFPADMDTAMRINVLKNEVLDILLLEEARAQGVDRLPETKVLLKQLHHDVLFFEMFRRAVSAPAEPTDADVAAYYDQHRDRYPGAKLTPEAAGKIKAQLSNERRAQLYSGLVARLRAGAKISVDEKALARVPVTGPPRSPGR